MDSQSPLSPNSLFGFGEREIPLTGSPDSSQQLHSLLRVPSPLDYAHQPLSRTPSAHTLHDHRANIPSRLVVDSIAAENDTFLMSPQLFARKSPSPFQKSPSPFQKSIEEGSTDWGDGLGDIRWMPSPEDTEGGSSSVSEPDSMRKDKRTQTYGEQPQDVGGSSSSIWEPDSNQHVKRSKVDIEPHSGESGIQESDGKTSIREQLRGRLDLKDKEIPSVVNNAVIDLSNSGHDSFIDKKATALTEEENESDQVNLLFANFEQRLGLLQGKYKDEERKLQNQIYLTLKKYLGEEKFSSGVAREHEIIIRQDGTGDTKRKALRKLIQNVYKDKVEYAIFKICTETHHPDPQTSSISLSTLVKYIPKMKDIVKRQAPRLYEILDLESNRVLALLFSICVVEYSRNTPFHEEPFFENFLLTIGPPKSLPNLLKNEETKDEINNVIIFYKIYMHVLLNFTHLINVQVHMHKGIKRLFSIQNVNPAFQNLFLMALRDQISNFTFYDVCDFLYTLRYQEVPFYDEERQVNFFREYHTYDRTSKYRLCDIFNKESKQMKPPQMSKLEEDTWTSLLHFMDSLGRERFIVMCYKLSPNQDYEVSEDPVYSKVQYLIQRGIKISERIFIDDAQKTVKSLTKLEDSINSTSIRSKYLIAREDTAEEQLERNENEVLEFALKNFMEVEGEPLSSPKFKNFISVQKKGIYDAISFKCLEEEGNPHFVENWVKIIAKSVQLFQSAYVNDVIETIYFIILCHSQIFYFDANPVTVNYQKIGWMKRSIIYEALLLTGEKRNRIIQNVRMWRYIVPFLGKMQWEQIHMLYEDTMHMHVATDSYEQRSRFVDTMLRDYMTHTWSIGGATD